MTRRLPPALHLLAAGAALALATACSPAAEAPADHADHGASGHGSAADAGSAPASDAAPAVVPGGSGEVGTIALTAARIRPPPGGRDVTAGYLTLTNSGAEPDRLVSATSPAAASIELHAHIHDGGMMKMEQVQAIDVPAGGTVTLEPGGLHLMLFGVKPDVLGAGPVPVTLTFERAGPVDVVFTVIEP